MSNVPTIKKYPIERLLGKSKVIPKPSLPVPTKAPETLPTPKMEALITAAKEEEEDSSSGEEFDFSGIPKEFMDMEEAEPTPVVKQDKLIPAPVLEGTSFVAASQPDLTVPPKSKPIPIPAPKPKPTKTLGFVKPRQVAPKPSDPKPAKKEPEVTPYQYYDDDYPLEDPDEAMEVEKNDSEEEIDSQEQAILWKQAEEKRQRSKAEMKKKFVRWASMG